MGNRVKGRAKRKSIKAAISSSAGSKRKLSRMGKKVKRHHGGLEATFIGRSACLKRLQISLKDFRRLCILKGIYPREPKGRTPGNKKGQVYYHVKDVRAIAHEPILEKFREFRAFMKKVRRAAGRNSKDEAARKHALAPTYTLHHLVRERYPRFVDALSDIDDALTLVFLFAALPSEGRIKSRVTTKAQRLAADWGAYAATTSSITRGFISVKGVYLEANVGGTILRWVIPHAFTQHLPKDVDYRVMLTFFEFYETLLGFVLFKLYNDLGVRYPLPQEAAAAKLSAGTGGVSALLATNLCLLRSGIGRKGGVTDVVSKAVENAAASETKPKGVDEDKGNVDENMGDSITRRNDHDQSKRTADKSAKKKNKALIQSVDVALSKISDEDGSGDDKEAYDSGDEDEGVDVSAPLRAALESIAEEERNAIIPASSGSVGAVLDDEAIKRRRLFSNLTFFLSREVPRGYLELICLSFGAKVGWDGPDSPLTETDPSITHHVVDRPKLTASYDRLPKSREYVQPQWIIDCANFMFLLPVGRYAVGATLPPHLSPWVDDDEEGYKSAYAEEVERLKNGEVLEGEGDFDMGVTTPYDDGTTDDKSLDEEEMHSQELAEESGNENEHTGLDDAETEESDKEESEDEDNKEANEKADNKRKKSEEEEAHELAKVMMSKKATRLYNRMQYGIERKKAKVDELHRRRKEIESTKEKNKEGKSALKQKVERLKKERRHIEGQYDNTGGSMKKRKSKN